MGANTYGNQKTANSTRARVTDDVLLQNNSSVHCENMFQSLLIKKKRLAKLGRIWEARENAGTKGGVW